MLHTPTLWHTEEGGGGRRAEARDDNLHRMTLLARCSIHLPQALAEALISSKAMVGRRLLQCSDLSKCIKVAGIKKCIGFEGACNAIVSGITATWSAAVKVANDATKAVRKAADVAAAATTKAFNEMKDKLEEAAKAAAAAATKTLNEVKDAAEKAAATATKFIDDVGNAFSELGDDIQCAAPPPAQGASPRGGGVSMAPHASRAAPWYPRATCRRVKPGATWQECLRWSGGSGPRHWGVCHEVVGHNA